MRIACVHIPQLSLQCVTRVDASLRGGAVAVVGADVRARIGVSNVLTGPVVLACSRAAWSLGVRLGMTAVSARALSPELSLVHAEPQLERETARAIADALLALSPTVDLGSRLGGGGAHLAMYAEVPAKMRGASFGERAREILDSLGLVGRIGIADDRFSAWVAASDGGGDWEHAVVTVPRGGSAAFLAPRPLSLLGIAPEVQHMLEQLGVSTLGAFASLPAPSVGRPIDRHAGGDYQALARGESGARLRPYAPEAAIREDIALEGIAAGLAGVSATGALAQRIALRLAGRDRLATRLEVTAIVAGDDSERALTAELPNPTTSAEEISAALDAAVASSSSQGAITRLRVVVAGEALADGADAQVAELANAPTIHAIAVALSSAGSGDLFQRSWAREAEQPSWSAPTASGMPHRRTRRGKQRRRLVPTAVQPRLFDRTSTT